MATFCSSAWPELQAQPLADTVLMAPKSGPHPTPLDPWQHPVRCRQTELQDFAERVAGESPVPFVIQWGAVPAAWEDVSAPQAHVLLTRAADGAWQARVCTDEELAHWLHALGMYVRAAQRQRHRQAHCQEHSSRQLATRDRRPLSPPLAC
jgi:hypothetical protein